MRLLYDAAGKTCWITVRESATTRYLDLDGCEEGAMHLTGTAPVFQYLWFHKCSILRTGPLRHALVLGSGAGTAAKCLALDHPDAHIDTVDVEPDLDAVGRRFFRLDEPQYAKVHFYGMPAHYFLFGDLHFDFVFDDLFDGFEHVPEHSRSYEHFCQLRQALAPGGVCVKNVIWDAHQTATQEACVETSASLKAVFPHSLTLALGDPQHGHNRLLLGFADKSDLNWSKICERLAETQMPRLLLEQVRVVKV